MSCFLFSLEQGESFEQNGAPKQDCNDTTTKKQDRALSMRLLRKDFQNAERINHDPPCEDIGLAMVTASFTCNHRRRCLMDSISALFSSSMRASSSARSSSSTSAWTFKGSTDPKPCFLRFFFPSVSAYNCNSKAVEGLTS